MITPVSETLYLQYGGTCDNVNYKATNIPKFLKVPKIHNTAFLNTILHKRPTFCKINCTSLVSFQQLHLLDLIQLHQNCQPA